MTACSVTCAECERTWSHLCVDCAREQKVAHRMVTGHRAELYIPTEMSMDDIRKEMRRARRLMRRFGW